MREIIYVQKDTVSTPGRTVLQEWRFHGQIDEAGGFRLLACCGKRIPVQSPGAGVVASDLAANKEAAA